MCQRFAIIALAAIAFFIALALNEGVQVSNSIFSAAEARVGRPLTPVSVAGVARRTVRRCAVGVYNC
jgi:predicted alpha/beta hydrolase